MSNLRNGHSNGVNFRISYKNSLKRLFFVAKVQIGEDVYQNDEIERLEVDSIGSDIYLPECKLDISKKSYHKDVVVQEHPSKKSEYFSEKRRNKVYDEGK